MAELAYNRTKPVRYVYCVECKHCGWLIDLSRKSLMGDPDICYGCGGESEIIKSYIPNGGFYHWSDYMSQTTFKGDQRKIVEFQTALELEVL